MNIQGLTGFNLHNRQKMSFKATPKEITTKLKENHKKSKDDDNRLCSGKTKVVARIRNFFAGLEKKLAEIPGAPQKYVYKLGEKNELPEVFKNIEVRGVTVKEFDEKLNAVGFKCSPDSTCGCGEGMTNSQYAVELFKMIGADNPDIIEISADK